MDLQVISVTVAKAIFEELSVIGLPPENRILVATIKGEQTLSSGIIIPGEVSENSAKRGVQVQCGIITEENASYNKILGTGQVIYYGDYAGKEIDTLPDKIKNVKLAKDIQFRVLSVTEIIYVENNSNK